MTPIIEIRTLVKTYGAFTAVDNVDLFVDADEIFGILGPNGAGKTTTLEMIEGLRKPDSGSITVAGIDAINDSDRVRPIIGVQLQTTALFDYLNASELIELFAGLYEVESGPEKVDRLLGMVDLREKAKAQVNTLSGGQKQRLSIALALVNTPKVVFLDEPSTGLDPGARRELWQMIRNVRAAGTAVVLTTHYMEEAEVLCDRVAVMDRGKVIACDTPSALIASLGIEATVRGRMTNGTVGEVALAAIPSVMKVIVEDDRLSLQTRDVQSTLIGLLELVNRADVTLTELTSQQSTLEDVFLSLTGRTYVHEESEPASESEGEVHRRRGGTD